MSSEAVRFIVQMPDLPLTEFRLLALIANDADEHGFAPQDVERWRAELSRYSRYQYVAQKLRFLEIMKRIYWVMSDDPSKPDGYQIVGMDRSGK